MSDEQFALSTTSAPSTPPPTEADYEAILAAVMETVRGRWFLSEFGRRNRQSDTRLVLAAIERLESMLRGERENPSFERIRFDIREMAKAIALTKREIAAIKPDHEHSGRIGKATEELDSIVQTTEQATSDILAATEQIQETAWTLREQGVDGVSCDQIDRRSTDIYLSCSFQDLTGQRIRKVIQVMRYLEGRINAMLDILGVDETDAAPAEMPAEGPNDSHASDFDTSLDQAEIDQVVPAVQVVQTAGDEQSTGYASHLVIDHEPDHAADFALADEAAPATAEPEVIAATAAGPAMAFAGDMAAIDDAVSAQAPEFEEPASKPHASAPTLLEEPSTGDHVAADMTADLAADIDADLAADIDADLAADLAPPHDGDAAMDAFVAQVVATAYPPRSSLDAQTMPAAEQSPVVEMAKPAVADEWVPFPADSEAECATALPADSAAPVASLCEDAAEPVVADVAFPAEADGPMSAEAMPLAGAAEMLVPATAEDTGLEFMAPPSADPDASASQADASAGEPGADVPLRLAPEEPALLSALEQPGSMAPVLKPPFAPDTQALLADLLSIIRPITERDQAQAELEEITLDRAEASAAAETVHRPAEDAVPLEAAGDPASPAGIATDPAAIDAGDMLSVQAADAIALHEAEVAFAVEPSAEFAAAPLADVVPAEVAHEREPAQPAPDAPAPSPISGYMPLEHVDIVDSGIMSPDFTIVAVDGLAAEAYRGEPEAEVAAGAAEPDRDGAPMAAADLPARPDPVLIDADLPETDIIAIEHGGEDFLPVTEAFASRTASPMPAAAEHPPGMEEISFASRITTPEPAASGSIRADLPAEPAAAAPSPPEAEVDLGSAEIPASIVREVAMPAGLTAEVASLVAPPAFAAEAAPSMAAGVVPPVTPPAPPMAAAAAGNGPVTPAARVSTPALPGDPLGAIAALSAEEKIALFS